MTGNQSDLARHLGVNRSTISRAVRDGRLVAESDGHFDLDKNTARWHQTAGGRSDMVARHAAQRGASIPTGQPAAENPTSAHGASQAAGLDAFTEADASRTRAKALLLHYENSAIKLDMARNRGLRSDRDTVSGEASGLGDALRVAIERLVDHRAPALAVAAGQDPEWRARSIAAELRALRRAALRNLVRARRRIRDAVKQGGAA